MLSATNELMLAAMKSVEAFSTELATISWVWGGFTIDVYNECFLREHDDIDYLTLNLHPLKSQFIRLFTNAGWQAKQLSNGDLKLTCNHVKVHLGHVEFGDRVKWTHNGELGSIYFPIEWLNPQPVKFQGIELHVVKPEFQYIMIEHLEMLNPEWAPRDKDVFAKAQLKSILQSKNIDTDILHELVADVKP